MNKLIAVLFSFFPVIWGLSAATQKVAKACNYDPLLGEPLFTVASGPFYAPHKYIVWYMELKKYIPHIINSGTPYIFGGIVIFWHRKRNRTATAAHAGLSIKTF